MRIDRRRTTATASLNLLLARIPMLMRALSFEIEPPTLREVSHLLAAEVTLSRADWLRMACRRRRTRKITSPSPLAVSSAKWMRA